MKSFMMVLVMATSLFSQTWVRHDLGIDSGERIHCMMASQHATTLVTDNLYFGSDSGVFQASSFMGIGVTRATRVNDFNCITSAVYSMSRCSDSFIVALDTAVLKTKSAPRYGRTLLDSISYSVAWRKINNRSYTLVCGIKYMMAMVDSSDWNKTRRFPGDTIKNLTIWNTVAYASDGNRNWYYKTIYPSLTSDWVADTTIIHFTGSRDADRAVKITKDRKLMFSNGITWTDITGDLGDLDSVIFMGFGCDNKRIYAMKKDYCVYTHDLEVTEIISRTASKVSRQPSTSARFNLAGQQLKGERWSKSSVDLSSPSVSWRTMGE